MIRETRTFLLTIALPALFVAAGGAKLLLYMWDGLWKEEQTELDLRAQLIADAIEDRSRDADFDGREPPPHDDPPSRFRDHTPPPHDDPPPRFRKHEPPPHRPGHRRTSEKRHKLIAICEEVRTNKSWVAGCAAFEVAGRHGERIYATPDWPASPNLVGECHLGPPAGDGTLRVARADGGGAMRSRTVAIAAVGAVIVLLLVATLVAGGVFFLKSIRREQRESRKKTDFIDNVSHELRTPLAGIRLNAELLVENRIRDEERRRGALESILTESDRLERMVSELLDYSRLEKGTRRYSMETFNLAEFASGAAEAEGVASISGGRAHISVKGPGALVTADKDALRQIGVNLVTNAVKYSEDEIVVEVEGNEVRFMDRGRGIPPGCEERIFERFYRVDDSLTRRVNGCGLGLSIARALARGMGGEITYAHRPGGGSIFTLTLALADKHDGGADK